MRSPCSLLPENSFHISHSQRLYTLWYGGWVHRSDGRSVRSDACRSDAGLQNIYRSGLCGINRKFKPPCHYQGAAGDRETADILVSQAETTKKAGLYQ